MVHRYPAESGSNPVITLVTAELHSVPNQRQVDLWYIAQVIIKLNIKARHYWPFMTGGFWNCFHCIACRLLLMDICLIIFGMLKLVKGTQTGRRSSIVITIHNLYMWKPNTPCDKIMIWTHFPMGYAAAILYTSKILISCVSRFISPWLVNLAVTGRWYFNTDEVNHLAPH